MIPALETPFHLETTWIPGGESGAAYSLTLANRSGEAIEGFRLAVSGPGRVAREGGIEGGRLVTRLSNHAEFEPPAGFVLRPGRSWTLTVTGFAHAFRHWSDGARAAYLVLADGSTMPVAIAPTRAAGDNTPLRRGVAVQRLPSSSPVRLSVVPWPARVAVEGSLPPPAGLDLRPVGEAAAEAAKSFAALAEALFPAEALARPAAEGGFPVAMEKADDLGDEAYRIAFSPERVVLRASARTGFLYGLVTLGQILRGATRHPETFLFPSRGTIDDAPSLRWRGTMLDVSRQFYSTGEIKALLNILAWNKLNRFHWHLSDDESWRIEIDAYPSLTEIGAWRGHGFPLPPLLGTGPARTGGYYSKAAIREIVAHAAALGIEIVPEIDMPGHCYAMLQALPELRDPAETGTYLSVQGFPNNCLNPALEKTYKVLQTILDEVIALFPSKIVHLGADEVPLGAWSGSPRALDWLREKGGAALAAAHAARSDIETNAHGADEIEGSGAALLQAEFLARLQAFLASRGCVTGGWQEAAHGDVIDKAKSYLVGWRSIAVSAELAAKGYDIVVSPGQAYYLDMANGPDWSEPGASWAGSSSLEATYRFDPVAGWSEEAKARLLGIQACIWSEPMADRSIFDRLVFPRLSAIAETAWTPRQAKSFERFGALAGLMPVLYGWHDREVG